MRRMLPLVLCLTGCVPDQPAAVSVAPVRPAAAAPAQAAVPWWQVWEEGGAPIAFQLATNPATTPGCLYFGTPVVFGPFAAAPPGWYVYSTGPGQLATSNGYPAVPAVNVWGAYSTQGEAQDFVARHASP